MTEDRDEPEDLPEEYRYLSTQTCTRLANGNTIVCSTGGRGKGPQLVEVTPGAIRLRKMLLKEADRRKYARQAQ